MLYPNRRKRRGAVSDDLPIYKAVVTRRPNAPIHVKAEPDPDAATPPRRRHVVTKAETSDPAVAENGVA